MNAEKLERNNLLIYWRSSINNNHSNTSLIGELFSFFMYLQINFNMRVRHSDPEITGLRRQNVNLMRTKTQAHLH